MFTIKNTKLFVSAVTLSTRDNQNYQNFLARHLKDPCIGINKNWKVKTNIQQTSIYTFLNRTFSTGWYIVSFG